MKNWRAHLAGGLAGLANGLFGGGGGMVFLPILSRWGNLDERKLYATCVGVIFPVCLVSALVYLFRDGFTIMDALPYLLGGAAGGFAAGKWLKRMPVTWLRRLFGALLILSGIRAVLA